ncbi:fructokinase [Secundilactobacillus oryzae JCM 18671]|uniref:Fructokinase n=1 Tax=Secundilactobacillus oryzae JCM 18671 TaxID=1291743 RepID=A0A081BID6_9LACO|nr:fructokinase ScrK [Secundilactobacillus oryzae]GAK47804.1 fructokinase [Secundilactobacillus oryzae JCM 18671]
MQFGSIEAGGTKFVCAVGDEQHNLIDKMTFPTTDPEPTFQRTIDYFRQFPDIDAISISSFGPIEIRPEAPNYGYVTNTPKPNWSNVDFLGTIKAALNVPIYWTTDVNGSAYGEFKVEEAAHSNIKSLAYYTIGTGVGAGFVLNGQFLGDQGHPEMGHVRLKRHPHDLDFKGICPFHGDCLEGLVAGPTFEARLGQKGQDVPFDNEVWEIMAYYIAQAALQVTLMLRPGKIVFGGGVTSERFLEVVRRHFNSLMNNYLDVGDLQDYLTLPRVPDNGSATLGNFYLAESLYNQLQES